MADCCSNSSPTPNAHDCPSCGASATRVGIKTVYHQVRFPENQAIHPGDYCFCPAEACTVAYFSTAGDTVLKQQLRIDGNIREGLLCYCFDITEAQYRSALQAGSAAALKHFVIEQVKAGYCACEITNPSGQCCLAKFKQLEKQARQDFSRKLKWGPSDFSSEK